MKNMILSAVFALGLAVPGMATAVPVVDNLQRVETFLTDDILKAVAARSNYSYSRLCDLHQSGMVQIDKDNNGTYLVRVLDANGGGVVISILEDL